MDTNIMISEATEAEREITKSGVEAAVFVQCLNRCALFFFCFFNVFLQCLLLFVLIFRIRQDIIWMDHIRSIINQITSTAVLRRWPGWRPLQRSTSSSKELLEDSTSHRLSSSEEWPGPQILRVLNEPILTKMEIFVSESPKYICTYKCQASIFCHL